MFLVALDWDPMPDDSIPRGLKTYIGEEMFRQLQ